MAYFDQMNRPGPWSMSSPMGQMPPAGLNPNTLMPGQMGGAQGAPPPNPLQSLLAAQHGGGQMPPMPTNPQAGLGGVGGLGQGAQGNLMQLLAQLHQSGMLGGQGGQQGAPGGGGSLVPGQGGVGQPVSPQGGLPIQSPGAPQFDLMHLLGLGGMGMGGGLR